MRSAGCCAGKGWMSWRGTYGTILSDAVFKDRYQVCVANACAQSSEVCVVMYLWSSRCGHVFVVK
jgi:hypothetical protein